MALTKNDYWAAYMPNVPWQANPQKYFVTLGELAKYNFVNGVSPVVDRQHSLCYKIDEGYVSVMRMWHLIIIKMHAIGWRISFISAKM